MIEDWLKLYRIPGVGPVAFNKLLATFGSPAVALSASPSQWQQAGLKSNQCCDLNARDYDISADLEWLDHERHCVLTVADPAYPNRLRELPTPPPILYVAGDASLLNYPQLAIVGSRNPTRPGAANATAFAEHLAGRGLGITSGMARGIDGAAHEGALKAGGITIAVAGTGLDRVYPAQHRKLAHQIADEGALISEFPIGTEPRPENFPRRNRIISGLSLGTLVVEAAVKSGSLISARYALEQGKELFAIPGSIHNPQARGCHHLIQQGAKLVETADDILEELGPQLQLLPPEIPAEHSEIEVEDENSGHASLLNCIDFDPTPIDLIIHRSGLTAEEVSSMLLIMELENKVAAEPGGYYVRLTS